MQVQDDLRNRFQEQADYAYAFAASSNILGQVQTKLGQYQEAGLKFAQARSIYLELMEKYPDVAAYRNGFVNTVLSVAELATWNQSWSDAIDAYASVIQQIITKSPVSNMSDSVLLTKAYLGQAMSFKQLGEPTTSHFCAELGRNTIESWKDRDATSRDLYIQCSMLLE